MTISTDFTGDGSTDRLQALTKSADGAWTMVTREFGAGFDAKSTVTESVSSDGSLGTALLAFPFYDPTLPGENSSFIANPGAFAGNAVLTVTDFLQGLDLNLIHNVHNANGIRLDVFGASFTLINAPIRARRFLRDRTC